MKHFGKIIGSVLLSSAFLLPGSANAEIKERTIRFAFQNAQEHPQGQGAKKFAELVEQKSGGKIKVRLFPSGQLGGDLQTVSALQGGTIDITVLNAGLLVGQIKEFGLFDLPFLFDSAKQADAVVDGPFGQKLSESLAPKNLVGLGYWDLGFRNLTNSRRPVTKLEDIQGLKVRVVQSPLYIELFNTLGANAVPLPFPELYTALEQKTVDGQENPATVIQTSKFAEVQKFLTFTRHVYNPQILIFSKRVWDRYDPEERKLIEEAAAEAKAYQRQVSRDAEAKAVEQLKAQGMQLTELSPEEVARLRDKVKPVTEKFAKEANEAVSKELFAEVVKARATR
ncbi:ABC transporter substrate-binding protein [Microvirga sp. KLBC 81]|uniref:TRAP transporter substrate-binding protein n=1 Tax=Microvirga sp. KLBC 81 TaxID=1862707 RepID=UPI000D50B6C0|nr:TRAP transporter substrate-binding protein [Microvirga sp. KLBC 81]PVE21190.1 ABC transporter substrate-binding protein [Microvirga sp. KLBC 81]